MYKSNPDVIGKIYDPTVGAGYTFYINPLLYRLHHILFLQGVHRLQIRVRQGSDEEDDVIQLADFGAWNGRDSQSDCRQNSLPLYL